MIFRVFKMLLNKLVHVLGIFGGIVHEMPELKLFTKHLGRPALRHMDALFAIKLTVRYRYM